MKTHRFFVVFVFVLLVAGCGQASLNIKEHVVDPFGYHIAVAQIAKVPPPSELCLQLTLDEPGTVAVADYVRYHAQNDEVDMIFPATRHRVTEEEASFYFVGVDLVFEQTYSHNVSPVGSILELSNETLLVLTYPIYQDGQAVSCGRRFLTRL